MVSFTNERQAIYKQLHNQGSYQFDIPLSSAPLPPDSDSGHVVVLVVEGVGVHGVHLVEVVVVHQGEDGEGALRVGRLAVAVVLSVRPRADVLVQALSGRHPVVKPGGRGATFQ